MKNFVNNMLFIHVILQSGQNSTVFNIYWIAWRTSYCEGYEILSTETPILTFFVDDFCQIGKRRHEVFHAWYMYWTCMKRFGHKHVYVTKYWMQNIACRKFKINHSINSFFINVFYACLANSLSTISAYGYVLF